MNGLISDKLHEFQDEDSIDSRHIIEMTDFIFDRVENMVKRTEPKKYVGIFFDGVSPKAKMNLQRQRRYRECYKYIDKCKFQFNSISPGTEFMGKISEIIQEKIQVKKNSDRTWKNIEVVFSGPNVVGEAEYKMFEFFNEKNIINSKNVSYEKGCIYSTDSDFIILSLVNHCYKFLIYNEYYNRNNNNFIKKNFFSVGKFRQFIIDLFPKANEKEYDKLINDFICLCFLSENNYLPGIHDVLFDDIVGVYKENYQTIGFINDNGKLNEGRLKKYLYLLKEKTNPINKMIYYLDKMNSDFINNYNSDKSNNNDDDNNRVIKFGMYFRINYIYNIYLTNYINYYFIIFTEFVDDYSVKRNVYREVQSLCNDPNIKSKDIYFKDQNAIKYLKFLCSLFNLEYISGKKQIQIKNNDKRNNNNYWNLKNYCNQNNLDINNLKDLSNEKKENLIKLCKRYNIKYNIITYSIISKKSDHEEDPFYIMNDIQSKIDEDDRKGIFLKIKEEYYKVELFYNKYFKFFIFIFIY